MVNDTKSHSFIIALKRNPKGNDMASRVSLDNVRQWLVATLQANGGEMKHNDLAPLMQAEGYTSFIIRLFDFNKEGVIETSVKAQPNSKPIVIYRLPKAE